MKAVLFLAFAVAAHAAEFRVGAGIADHQVFQRNPQGVADIRIGGTADGLAGKPLEARILSGGKTLKGWSWKPVAQIAGATWTGSLPQVPTGGPYTIELRAAGSPNAIIQDVLVGDLWVLAGQSNMEGVGNLENVHPSDPRVHSFDQADQWGVAQEPLHNLPGAVDRVHWRNNPPQRVTGEALDQFNRNRRKGAGLGLPFAVEMVRRTNVPIGLVPCAHGGTSMAQWDPALKDKGGDSLYGAMIRRVEAVGGKVKGVLWYQGEAEANQRALAVFPAKFEGLVAAIRRDFGQPELPFYYVQIGRYIDQRNQAEWNGVQEAQRVLARKIPNAGVVASADLELHDLIHIGMPGLKRLGVRLANLATAKAKNPDVSTVTFDGAGLIRVRFADVNGKLKSDGRIGGFSVHGADGIMVPSVYRAEVDPAAPHTVLLYITGKLPENAALHYGFGKDPYCNLRDDADMAALVFGPFPIAR